VRIRLEECSQKLQTNQINLLDRVAAPDRAHSPEPEPIYDQHGKRINTREQRLKEKVGDERIRLIERAMAMNPLFRVHTTHYTLHTTHYTLHTTHYTLHTTRCTLHAAHAAHAALFVAFH
jgi:hypothetical protein